DFGCGLGEIAESDEIGIDRRIGPGEVAEFIGRGRRRSGVEARADEFEDAGELKIVADDLREESGMSVGVVGAGSEVGGRDTRLGDVAKASAGAEPIFSLSGRKAREKQDADRKNKKAAEPTCHADLQSV